MKQDNLKGVHFSNKAGLHTLTTFHFGTGKSGAEWRRLRATDAIRNRLYFYIDTGAGIIPEQGVGMYKYEVTLNNFYNIIEDSELLRLRNTAWSEDTWLNWVEQWLVAHGYAGIYNPLAQDTQGVAVLLGEHFVMVK